MLFSVRQGRQAEPVRIVIRQPGNFDGWPVIISKPETIPRN